MLTKQICMSGILKCIIYLLVAVSIPHLNLEIYMVPLVFSCLGLILNPFSSILSSHFFTISILFARIWLRENSAISQPCWGSLNVIYHSSVGTFWGFLAESTGSTSTGTLHGGYLPQAVSPPAEEQRVKCSRCISVVRNGSNSRPKAEI